MSKQPKLEEWEQIQTRTFTRWVNAQLGKRGMKIETLFGDFETGIKLINLYEAISDEDLGKYNKNPKMKIQKIENLNICLQEINKFVDSVGIKLQFSSEQVFASEKNQILGMIWVLIHKFEIQDITEEEFSAREGLLLWCQKKTKGYKGVTVKNFSSSWQDGLAFCALIHKHHPNLIDFDSLEKGKAKENLQLAFDVAEKNFGIPQLLDANDMVDYKPDDKSVMTYVAYYWKAFAASNKQNKAASQVARVAKNVRDNAQIASDYEERAKKLKAWIADNDEKLKDTDNFGNDLEQVMQKAVPFNDFKKNQKPKQQMEKADLALMLTNLQNKQRNEMVPIYQPPKELTTKAIQDSWDELESDQKTYDEALREAIKRMKYLEMCLARFRSRSKKVLSWQDGKSELVLQAINSEEALQKLRANLKMVEALEEEKKSVDSTLESTSELGTEIVNAGHSAAQEVTDTVDKMKEGDEKLTKETEIKKSKLVAIIKFKQEIEDMCVQFSSKSETLSLFLGDCDLVLTEPVKASSVKDVEDSQAIVAKLIDTHKLNEELLGELKTLSNKVSDAGADVTIYSRFNYSQLEGEFKETGDRLKTRTEDLEVEHKRQQKNAELLQNYANNVTGFKKHTDEQFQVITKDRNGELEDQLKSLHEEGKKALDSVENKLGKLREDFTGLEEADIAEYAATTTQELEVLQQQVKNAYLKRAKGIEQDIYAKKMSSVSEEQLKDLMDTFKHFDKDSKSSLNKNEFKAACASVGEDIPDDLLDDTFKKFDQDKDGFINFSEFISFMSGVLKQGTSYEDVIASFKELAGGANTITESQIRSNLEKEEAEYLLTEMPKKGDAYDYVAYAKKTFGHN